MKNSILCVQAGELALPFKRRYELLSAGLNEYHSQPVEGVIVRAHYAKDVDACIRCIHVHKPKWWAFTTTAKTSTLGPCVEFYPWMYAGWADEPPEEAWTQKNYLWTNLPTPPQNPRMSQGPRHDTPLVGLGRALLYVASHA